MASPLYDLYDPEGILARRAKRTGDKRFTISDLLPEEEKRGMLHGLASVGGSGLSMLGWLLDTPGAAVRGLLSGGPLKALSAFAPGGERVSGRDLLRQYGMVGNDDTWGNFSSGLAAEVLLDPSTYLTLGASQLLGRGAKTAAGELLSKSGLWQHLDAAAAQAGMGPRQFARSKTINDLVDALPDTARKYTQQSLKTDIGTSLLSQATEIAKKRGLDGADATDYAINLLTKTPLSQSNAWSIPFYSRGSFDLFGKQAGDAMAKFGDAVGSALTTAPVLSRLRPMFDTRVMEMLSPARWTDAQRLHADRTLGVPSMTRAMMSKVIDASEYIKQANLTAEESEMLKRHLTNLLAGHDFTRFPSAEMQQRIQDLIEHTDTGQLVRTPLGELVQHWGNVGPKYVQDMQAAGLPVEEFTTQSRVGRFFPAQKIFFDTAVEALWPNSSLPRPTKSASRMRGEQVAQVADVATMPRQPHLDIPAREELLAAMTTDAQLQKALRASDNAQAPAILEKWFQENYQDVYDHAAIANRADDQSPPLPGLFGWVDRPGSRRAPPLGKSHPLTIKKRKLNAKIKDLRARGFAAQGAGLNSAPFFSRAQRAEKMLAKAQAQARQIARSEWKQSLYAKLADTLRNTDPQHANSGIPLFGMDPLNALVNYDRNRAEMLVNANFLTDLLGRSAVNTPAAQVPGGLAYSLHEAAAKLGLDPVRAEGPLANAIGRFGKKVAPDVSELAGMSVEKSLIDDWARRVNPAQSPSALQPFVDAFDNYTQAFKTGSLLYPSRYTRDLYSGAMASLTRGLLSAESRNIGSAMRRGDYAPLREALGKLQSDEWASLDPQARVKKFLLDMATQGVSTGTERDVLRGTPSAARRRAFYPGANAPSTPVGFFGGVPWKDLVTWNKVAPPAIDNEGLFSRLKRGSMWSNNPLVEYGDQWAEYTDAANRFGAYTEAILQGKSPTEAKRLADLTQVNYAPDAFTGFERTFMRRLFPFYSYTRGILPLVFSNALEGPRGGMASARSAFPSIGVNPQNLAVRILNRAAEPSEDNFTPEHLRQSASIPIPGGIPFLGLPADSSLQRYLTNIDLPFQAPLDLLAIGTGNNAYDVAANTLKGTASNLIGQSHPLPKTLLEIVANRQFYSGRQLSDLYSMLEQYVGSPGRSVEQIAAGMVPFGSRALGLARQATDNRLTPLEKALKVLVNSGSGLKFQDVDEERTRQFAARDTLNKLLTASPNVRTYENIVVKEEDLGKLSPQQRKLYLLYKVLQADAAKRSREKKKAKAASSLLSR